MCSVAAVVVAVFRPIECVGASGVVSQVFKPVVAWVSVVVTHFKPFGAWPDECLGDERVDEFDLNFVVFPQTDVFVALTSVVRFKYPFADGFRSSIAISDGAAEASHPSLVGDLVTPFVSGDLFPVLELQGAVPSR